MTEIEVKIPIKHMDLKSYAVFASDPPDILHHYTDLNGASGIISSKSLRLTKLSYLNDTSELKHGISMFQGHAEKTASKIADTEKREFLYIVARQLNSFEDINICVSSFCEDGDLLSQWRAYGRTIGVAIGFSSNQLRRYIDSGLLNLWKCVYDPSIQNQIIIDLIEILLKSYDIIESTHSDKSALWNKAKQVLIGHFNTTFLRVTPVLKSVHFSEEKEWRLISAPIRSDNKDYHALISNNRVTQYYSLNFLNFPEDGAQLIDKVSIGPSKAARVKRVVTWAIA